MKTQFTFAMLLALPCLAPTSHVNAAANWRVDILPINICNNDGTVCANNDGEVWEDVGDKIWAQAGIDLHFLPWSAVYNEALLSLDQCERGLMISNPAAYGGSNDPTVVNMWFAQNMTADGTTQGSTRIFLNWPYLRSQGGGEGQRDVPFHELGHALGYSEHFGIPDPDDPFGKSSNLMAGGDFRKRYEGIENIYPDGLGRDRLMPPQIALILMSPMVYPIPEPASFLLGAIGILSLFVLGYRNR
ncbi:MAG: hypothetical protein IT425_09310 [Pirellulales bacterium]|nr:hypothetical protein [Pirellulales bacterium]